MLGRNGINHALTKAEYSQIHKKSTQCQVERDYATERHLILESKNMNGKTPPKTLPGLFCKNIDNRKVKFSLFLLRASDAALDTRPPIPDGENADEVSKRMINTYKIYIDMTLM